MRAPRELIATLGASVSLVAAGSCSLFMVSTFVAVDGLPGITIDSSAPRTIVAQDGAVRTSGERSLTGARASTLVVDDSAPVAQAAAAERAPAGSAPAAAQPRNGSGDAERLAEAPAKNPAAVGDALQVPGTNQVGSTVNKTTKNLSSTLKETVDGVTKTVTGLTQALRSPGEGLGGTVNAAGDTLGGTVTGLTTVVGDTLGAIAPGLGQVVTGTGAALGGTVQQLVNGVGNLLKGALAPRPPR